MYCTLLWLVSGFVVQGHWFAAQEIFCIYCYFSICCILYTYQYYISHQHQPEPYIYFASSWSHRFILKSFFRVVWVVTPWNRVRNWIFRPTLQTLLPAPVRHRTPDPPDPPQTPESSPLHRQALQLQALLDLRLSGTPWLGILCQSLIIPPEGTARGDVSEFVRSLEMDSSTCERWPSHDHAFLSVLLYRQYMDPNNCEYQTIIW